MKQFSHKVRAIVCSALFVASTIAVGDNRVSPFLNFRSPGSNSVDKITGMNQHKFLSDMDGFYGTLAANFKYERSFREHDINEMLFGPFLVDSEKLNITGPAVTGRSETKDLLASHFLLPSDFSGSITFEPRVQNFVLFLEAYFSFDEWWQGLYLDIYGTVVHSRYDLNAEDTGSGSGGYAAGVLSKNEVAASGLHAKPLDFFSGRSLSIAGVTVQPLQEAKIKAESDKETAFSELRAELGYNFWLTEDYHLGINLQVGFPTGNKPEGEFLFEAMPSSGKYFKLGGGVTGHYTLWRSECGNQHFDIAMDVSAVHWFNGKQRRTFDLKGKPLSRYILAQRMKAISPAGSLLVGPSTPPIAPNPAVQFADEYAPVANFSTREVKVSVGAEIDAAVWFAFICKGWEFDLGYNLWYRSEEKIKLKDDQSAFPTNWAIKGIAYAYGAANPLDFANTAVALSGTDSAATITAFGTGDSFNFAFTTLPDGTIQPLTNFSGTPAQASLTPVIIKESDLDLEGAETRGLTHKVFGHFSYSWLNMEDWVPYLGLTMEAEFGQHSTDSSSRNIGLSKWAVAVKVGVSFD
jgi:hypothetical protein